MKYTLLKTVFIAALCGCSSDQNSILPTVEDITESVYASGVVKSSGQYQVFATGNGILENIYFKEGDTVQTGDVLFSLSSGVPRLNLENAELASGYADYENNRMKLTDARINVELALKKKQQDSLVFERQKNLWNNHIGSRLELEQKELAYTGSATAYTSALLRLKDLERQLMFGSRQSKKNLEISRQMVSDYRVQSKMNGKLYSILRKQGEMVSTQTPLAIIGNAGEFIAELQVDEYDIAVLKPGMDVYMTLDSYKDSVYTGKLTRIYPIMNEKSKTFMVEAAFTKRPPSLFPNLTLEASIVLRSKRNALTIPVQYLVNDSTVLLKDGSFRTVKTGLKDYRKVEITGGLNKGEAIIMP